MVDRIGDKPGPDGPDEETVLRAWDMRVERRSLAYIAEQLKVSISSAKRYVKAGRELAEAIDYSEATNPARVMNLQAERERSAAVLDLVQGWLVDYVEAGGDEVQAATVVLKGEERRAKLLGLDAERVARLSLEQGGEPPAPSPTAVAAVRQYQQERERARGAQNESEQ